MARARKKVLVPADDRPGEPQVVTTDPAQQEPCEQPAPKPRRTRKAASRKPPAPPSPGPVTEPGEAARQSPPPAPELPQQQVNDLAGQLEEMRRQSLETWEQLRALRQQTEEAQRQFLRDTLAASQHVREEVAANEGQLRAGAPLFQDAGQRLQALPRQADELHEQFRRMAALLPTAQKQLQSAEQEAEAAREELTKIEEESRDARQRLDTI